jgi:hypothetical protein
MLCAICDPHCNYRFGDVFELKVIRASVLAEL